MVAEPPIRAWVICISGFLQHEGRASGISRIWRDLHREHAGPDVCVVQRAWSDCTWSLAEMIWRLRPDHEPPVIGIIGYSWGAASAINLCRELQRRGMPVARLYTIDGVYRHWYALGQWRAWVPWSTLRVPGNVLYAKPWIQRENLPCGHELVALDPAATELATPERLGCVHQYADDHVAVYQETMYGVLDMLQERGLA